MPKIFDISHTEILHTLLEILDPKDRSKNRAILSDGSIIHSSSDTENYNMFDYYDDFCVGTRFEHIQKPHILLHACFSMPWFENLRYDISTINYLNDLGLEIYLMEPLFLYTGPKKKFYRELLVTPPGGEEFENLETTFPTGIKDFRSYELDSIEDFVIANGLKNVTVYLESIDNENILNTIYKNFSIATDALWPLTYRNILTDYTEIFSDQKDIQNKFLCTNRRYEPHRHMMSAFLSSLDCKISWVEETDLKTLKKRSWFDLDDFPYLERLQKGCIDLTMHQRGPLEGNEFDIEICPTGLPLPIEHYKRSFCVVITEPNFAYPFSLFSEKVINCMIMERPFILVAPAGTIKYLKDLGFQTFDRWWSEDYDEIVDHRDRLIRVMDLIDSLDQYSIEEMRSIYSDMCQIINHNKLHTNAVKQI